MIRIYCEDIAKRVEIQNFYRDHGLAADAPPCGEFLCAAREGDTTMVLIVGTYPPWLDACLRVGLPAFFVGNAQSSFDSYDDGELLALLLATEGDIRRFNYGQCLSSSPDGVYYLGYPLRLTPSELAILSYLVKQSPNAVKDEELLSVCVGDAHRKSSVLRQHVSSINKKAKTIYSGRDLIASDRKRDGVKHYFMVKYI
jgi:hypothetical protein